MSMINPLNLEALKQQWTSARPYPHVILDNFLEPGAAQEIARSYPTFDQALKDGFAFNFVNEQRKIQISQSAKFPESMRRLNDAISSPKFLADLEYVTGIPGLFADEQLSGGGMHLTGSGGRLDVHVDFNRLDERQIFRRLNILLYLNPNWKEESGGQIELWDKTVKVCHLSALPVINRCLIFETSDHSYHGVRPVVGPPELVRRSFAAYYYTREAPPNWDGVTHSTIFRARPDEKFRGYVTMPAERLKRNIQGRINSAKQLIKSLLGRG
jgi:Rps23 Pro-64 3,4-dihydroxylase Tpa1-like proline 4-hydroxylase